MVSGQTSTLPNLEDFKTTLSVEAIRELNKVQKASLCAITKCKNRNFAKDLVEKNKEVYQSIKQREN